MRNSWNGSRWAILAAVSTMAALPVVAAQDKTTAGSEQNFLASMTDKVVTKVYFVDAQDRTNHVTGKTSGEVKTSKFSNIARTKVDVRPLPERIVDKQLWDVRAVTLDAIDVQGRPNECATRITSVTAAEYDETKSDVTNESATFSWKQIETTEQWKYEPLTKFTSPPQVIDWKNVAVSRSADSQITVTSYGQAFAKIHLTFVPGDLDLADRIEYAMKFLALSCDATASARF